MTRPRHHPTQTHCMVCGAGLTVEQPRRVWVRGLFDRSHWRPAMICPECGARSGGGRTVMMTHGHPSQNPVKRLMVRFLRQGRTGMTADDLAAARPVAGSEGSFDLARFLETTPYPAYGLSGRPMGFRLRTPGRNGGHGLKGVVDRTRLGYVSGEPFDPERAVEISQGITEPEGLDRDSDPGSVYLDLFSIRSVVANYAPKKLRDKDPFFADFHLDWNKKRIENTPRQRTTLQVNGEDVEACFMSWDTPYPVVLCRLEMKTHSLSVAALNVSWDNLRGFLSSLVVLLDHPEVLAGHQQDFDEALRKLRERNSHGSHGDGRQT